MLASASVPTPAPSAAPVNSLLVELLDAHPVQLDLSPSLEPLLVLHAPPDAPSVLMPPHALPATLDMALPATHVLSALSTSSPLVALLPALTAPLAPSQLQAPLAALLAPPDVRPVPVLPLARPVTLDTVSQTTHAPSAQ